MQLEDILKTCTVPLRKSEPIPEASAVGFLPVWKYFLPNGVVAPRSVYIVDHDEMDAPYGVLLDIVENYRAHFSKLPLSAVLNSEDDRVTALWTYFQNRSAPMNFTEDELSEVEGEGEE